MSAKWLTSEESAAWTRLVAVLELLPAALDTQLRRDADLTNFDYYVLAMLSQAPDHPTLRMTELARPDQCDSSPPLPRGEATQGAWADRAVPVSRGPARHERPTHRHGGWSTVPSEEPAPRHVAWVREHVIDALTPEQVEQLGDIADALLGRLDPSGRMTPMYRRHDAAQE